MVIIKQSAALALDDTVLDVDQVENLIKFCPTKEEMELLKVFIIRCTTSSYFLFFIISKYANYILVHCLFWFFRTTLETRKTWENVSR